MREKYEFRVQEKYANLLFDEDEGTKLGWIRQVTLLPDDPKFTQMGMLSLEPKFERDGFFLSWQVRRSYSKQELNEAVANRIIVKSVIEQDEDCLETDYDYTNSCPVCGFDRVRRSPLIADFRRISKNRDIVRTIGNEWIISDGLAKILEEEGVEGYGLGEVLHKRRNPEISLDFRNFEAGRKLIEKFEANNPEFSYGDPEFAIWINIPENRNIVYRIKEEMNIYDGKLSKYYDNNGQKWHHLQITAPRALLSEVTKFGITPFDTD